MLSTLAKFFLVSLFVLMAQVFCSPDASAAKLGPGRYEQTITVDKLVRKFIVFVPASYNYAPTPLVLNFHGSGSNDVQQEAISLMDINATKNGYIVCYPDAVFKQFTLGQPL